MRGFTVCIHFRYRGRETPSRRDIQALELARALGARLIRFDIWWSDLMPAPGSISAGAIGYYKRILLEARRRGLEPIVIVGTGLPKWVIKRVYRPIDRSLYRALEETVGASPSMIGGGFTGSLAAYTAIACGIASRYTRLIQVCNEPNNRLLWMGLPMNPLDYTVAVGRLVHRLYREISGDEPEAIVNTYACIPGWRRFHRAIARRMRGTIGILAIDYYPGVWCSCMKPLSLSPISYAVEAARILGLKPAVMETGYPSGGLGVCPTLFTEEKQASFIKGFIARLAALYGDRLETIAWYELFDEPYTPMNRILCEGFFGLVDGRGRLKRGFRVLRRVIRELSL